MGRTAEVESIRWDDVREWFDPVENGSAPDVVVAGTGLADWETLLGLARAEGWRVEFEVDGERRPLPATAAGLFEARPADELWNLWVWPDPGLEWIIRLWTPEEILSDVSLHQIQGQERLDAFCRFLRTLGGALGRPVLVYAEGAYPGRPPMMAYEQGRVVFTAGPWR